MLSLLIEVFTKNSELDHVLRQQISCHLLSLKLSVMRPRMRTFSGGKNRLQLGDGAPAHECRSHPLGLSHREEHTDSLAPFA